MDWFANKQKPTRRRASTKLDIPGDLWVKCYQCGDTLYLKELNQNQKVCIKCNYHFRITSDERIHLLFDEDTFQEIDADLASVDFLHFMDTESYADRIKKTTTKTQKKDAIVIGTAALEGQLVNAAIMEFAFMGGSMGSVVGEKIVRITELALENKAPLIIFSSSGGARMQEGILSLMQLAKTSAGLSRLSEAGIPYISILCDPTTGGVSASFAMLGDLIFAEPGALVCFAGPRVIEQTIRQKLPEGFQRAEFLLEHGMIDRVVDRRELRGTLSTALRLMSNTVSKR